MSGTRVELVASAFAAAELNLPIIESTEEQQNRLKLEYEKRLASLAISDPCLVDELVDDITKWPPVSLGSIFSCILKVRDFDREYVGKYKDQKAYSYFDSGFVDTILVHEPKEQNCKKFVYVYCKVTASQSVNEKKELWVVIDKKSGEECLAWCSCIAGERLRTCSPDAVLFKSVEEAHIPANLACVSLLDLPANMSDKDPAQKNRTFFKGNDSWTIWSD